jgi:hypothetical protein
LENDGDPTTGGTARQVSNGDETPNNPSDGEASPEPEDIDGFDPEYGQTASPPDPSAATDPTAPAIAEDLTAEEAHNSTLLDTVDRGVLLIWNETSDEDSSAANTYVIQRRMVGAADWDTIRTINWLSLATNERTSFTDPSEPAEGEVREYRIGTRGSAAVAPDYTDPVMYPQSHPEGHDVELGTPTMVEAMSDASGELTISWQGADNAERYVLIAVNSTDFTYGRTDVDDGMARMGTVTGLTPGASYIGIVVAIKGSGDDLEVMHASTGAMPVQ